MQNCPLICLGKGKYYKEDSDLTLDVGPFAAGILHHAGFRIGKKFTAANLILIFFIKNLYLLIPSPP
jgi:hypothetical protein